MFGPEFGRALVTGLLFVIILSFLLGAGCVACVARVGHPTIGWSH